MLSLFSTVAAGLLAAGVAGGPPKTAPAGPPKTALSVASELAPRKAELVSTVATVERILMPKLRGPADVRVDALRATVAITAPRDLGAVAAKISSSLGELCPRWEVDGARILLRCRTRQLEAEFVDEGGKKYLDLHELRGLPRRAEEDQLSVFYDPARVGLGGGCPGTLAVAKGECALHEGDRAAAFKAFTTGADTEYRTLASLRLGDLFADKGDLTQAAFWWSEAGTTGPFGRLARGRLCELRGDCLSGPTSYIFDAGEIAEPMRTELALRAARIDLYGGRTGLALRWLGDLINRGPTSGGCLTVGRTFCRRMVLAALEEDRGDGGREALELYLALPDRLVGPYALEMARAAGEKAAGLGAPVFGANLFASVAGLVADADMSAHLARAIELYLQGDDRARAQLVLDYAESRLTPKAMATPRWASVRRGLFAPTAAEMARDQREQLERDIVGAEAALDVANAVRVLARTKYRLP
jgi:hypothetical protein